MRFEATIRTCRSPHWAPRRQRSLVAIRWRTVPARRRRSVPSTAVTARCCSWVVATQATRRGIWRNAGSSNPPMPRYAAAVREPSDDFPLGYLDRRVGRRVGLRSAQRRVGNDGHDTDRARRQCRGSLDAATRTRRLRHRVVTHPPAQHDTDETHRPNILICRRSRRRRILRGACGARAARPRSARGRLAWSR
jgi:hypothetical protein